MLREEGRLADDEEVFETKNNFVLASMADHKVINDVKAGAQSASGSLPKRHYTQRNIDGHMQNQVDRYCSA